LNPSTDETGETEHRAHRRKRRQFLPLRLLRLGDRRQGELAPLPEFRGGDVGIAGDFRHRALAPQFVAGRRRRRVGELRFDGGDGLGQPRLEQGVIDGADGGDRDLAGDRVDPHRPDVGLAFEKIGERLRPVVLHVGQRSSGLDRSASNQFGATTDVAKEP
jgi:hypothetical protein